MRRWVTVLVVGAAPVTAMLSAGCSGDDPQPTTDTAPYSREKLLDPATCNECHKDHYREWSGSMHAYASTDPVFRAMNERGQKETGGALGNFCVNCHAPLAVSEGKTEDGTNLDSVPAELQGVTCYFCHNVTEVRDTHNNPLVLANDATMRGGIKAPTKFRGHRSEYSKLHDSRELDSSKTCGACHDIVVPGHFAGAVTDAGATTDVFLEKTFAEWKESIFSIPLGPDSPALPQNCGTCHFSTEPNVPIASPPGDHVTMPSRLARHVHTFPAVDTALVDFPRGDLATQEEQRRQVKDQLDVELRVEACVDQSGRGIRISLENLGAAHHFPSGASQDRRLWVELHGYRGGMEVFTNGVVPAGTAATDVAGTWILRDETLKADGTTPAHMFWDVARVNGATIGVSTLEKFDANVRTSPVVPGSLSIGALLDRLTVQVWLEPIGLDVLDDMVRSGYLDGSFRDAMPRLPIVFPGLRGDVALEWTLEKAKRLNGGFCQENTIPKFASAKP